MNAASIRHTILTVLASVAPHALPHEQLLREVNRLLRPGLADGHALYLHLTWLLDRSFVHFLPDDLDPDNGEANRWLITEAGQATLKR
jgi:hypothetical protein